jgi:hypothetical protein
MKHNNIQSHCDLCCDDCNEMKTSYQTPCGGYVAQCINPIKGYTIYQTKCSCSPYFGQHEVIYLKFLTPYSQHQTAQCHFNLPQNQRKMSWNIIFEDTIFYIKNFFKF